MPTLAAPALRELLLLTNGPGELLTWVPPVLAALQDSGLRVELYLLQDQFSSGTEILGAQGLEVAALGGRREFLARAAGGKSGARGQVLLLGGAARDALILSRRLGYPAYAYSFHGRLWNPGFTKLLVDSPATRAEALQRGADPERVLVVGNLVVDALEAAKQQESIPADILLLPGSRPFYAQYLFGFLLRAAEELAQTHPELRFAWLKSRLIPDQALESIVGGAKAQIIGGTTGRLLGDRVISAGGLEVSIIPDQARYAAMTGAQQAWTIPGTNTLELALAGLPSLVLLPLHRPELLPLEGVAHWLSLIPILGPWAKRRVIAYLEPRAGLLALPNQRLGQMVFPELRGTFTPFEVARKAQELLLPERSAEVRNLLTGLPREPGAQRLAEVLLS